MISANPSAKVSTTAKRPSAPEGMSDEAVLAKVTPALQKAISVSQDEIGLRMASGMKLYLRDPFSGDDKLVGRSTYVAGDARNAVQLMTASLLRIFDSTAKVVEYLPNGVEDEPLARQQTDVINYVARESNSHGAYLHEWFTSGLACGLGILTEDLSRATGWTPARTMTVPEAELGAMLAAEEAGDIRIIAVGEPTVAPPPSPELPPVEVREIQIRTKRQGQSRITIQSIPVDRFIVSADACFDQSTGGIAAALQGYWRIVPRHELVEMGFDKVVVASIPNADSDDSELNHLRTRATGQDDGTGETHTDDVRVNEVFMRVDADRDGYAELIRLTIGGDPNGRCVVLGRQEVSCPPFAAFSPYALPNSLFGGGMTHAIADEVRLASQLKRAVIDNLHLSNYPVRVANPEAVNFDDLLAPHADKIVRSSDPSGGISYIQPPNVAGASYQYLGMLSDDMEQATGVGRNLMGIDGSSLQVETATGAAQRAQGAQMLVEKMARQVAETGYRYLFRVLTSILIDNPEEAASMTARLTNGYVPMATDGWNPELDLRANVGFGQTDKATTMASLQMILGLQREAMQAGLSDPSKLFATASLLVEAAGYKTPERFFIDPTTIPPEAQQAQQQQPDPEMVKVQAQIEALKAKAEADAQLAQMKLQAELELERFKAEAGIQLDRQKAEMEFQLKMAELGAEAQLAAIRDPSAPNIRFPE